MTDIGIFCNLHGVAVQTQLQLCATQAYLFTQGNILGQVVVTGGGQAGIFTGIITPGQICDLSMAAAGASGVAIAHLVGMGSGLRIAHDHHIVLHHRCITGNIRCQIIRGICAVQGCGDHIAAGGCQTGSIHVNTHQGIAGQTAVADGQQTLLAVSMQEEQIAGIAVAIGVAGDAGLALNHQHLVGVVGNVHSALAGFAGSGSHVILDHRIDQLHSALGQTDRRHGGRGVVLDLAVDQDDLFCSVETQRATGLGSGVLQNLAGNSLQGALALDHHGTAAGVAVFLQHHIVQFHRGCVAGTGVGHNGRTLTAGQNAILIGIAVADHQLGVVCQHEVAVVGAGSILDGMTVQAQIQLCAAQIYLCAQGNILGQIVVTGGGQAGIFTGIITPGQICDLCMAAAGASGVAIAHLMGVGGGIQQLLGLYNAFGPNAGRQHRQNHCNHKNHCKQSFCHTNSSLRKFLWPAHFFFKKSAFRHYTTIDNPILQHLFFVYKYNFVYLLYLYGFIC